MEKPWHSLLFSVSLPSILQSSLDLAIGIVLGDRIALVVELFASTEPELNLYARAREIEREGNKGNSLLRDETEKLEDLALVHQKLALTHRVAIEDISVLIGTDVHTDDEKLAVLEVAVGVLEIDRACAQTFDLRAEKLDARLVFFVHEIVVIRFFVLGNYLMPALFISQNGHLLFSVWNIIIQQTQSVVKAFCVEETVS